MAISPPSDIVLDVARAAGPEDIRKAHAELMNRIGGSNASFEVANPPVARAAEPAKGGESFRRFEAMVLQTFIQNMLPKDAEGVYGKGFAGDMWKTQMAERLADTIAERGGIGIAKALASAHYLSGAGAEAANPASPNRNKAELNAQLNMSSSLVHQLQMRVVRSLGEAGQTLPESRSK